MNLGKLKSLIKMSLILDHINGNCKDHRLENLRIVCYPESKLLFEQIFKTKYIVISHDEIFLNGRIASSKARKKIKSIKPFKIYDITGESRSATLIAASGVAGLGAVNGGWRDFGLPDIAW